jgi:hypothetical protein
MITNNLGLPEPLVAAVANDPYDNAGTLSVTTLLKPTQAVVLGKHHGHEITEDAADRIWSLMGQIGHSIVERAAPLLGADYITERRFVMEISGAPSMPQFETNGRLLVSGAADLVTASKKLVEDFKFTSGWAVMDAAKPGGKSDWRYQLSALAMLARGGRYIKRGNVPVYNHDGDLIGIKPDGPWVEVEGPPIEITHGKIVAVVRDWTKTQALKNPDWPQQPVAMIDMDILPDAEVRDWLDMRIEALKFALDGGDVPCTDEERWAKQGKWAVHKIGVQKAAKLADTEDELSAWIFANRAKLGRDYRIEERPAVYTRCNQYCSAAPFCRQHQQSLQAAETNGDD